MATDSSTIQSLKAVDAWIDVINANVNGGVHTAFNASRLKFAGSNTDVSRAGTSTSLPLQFPEPGLTTANTVIDFSQGAITASTENTHLAIQVDGFFLLADPATIDPATGMTVANAAARFYATRDGEFHTGPTGLLVHSSGYYLVRSQFSTTGGGNRVLDYATTTAFAGGCNIRAAYDDMDLAVTASSPQRAMRLTDYVGMVANATDLAGISTFSQGGHAVRVDGDKQSLTYSSLGSTIVSCGFQTTAVYNVDPPNLDQGVNVRRIDPTASTILSKSLAASNASMTQSVPALSLAQNLFSALTKVLQTRQTNVDGVRNLVR